MTARLRVSTTSSALWQVKHQIIIFVAYLVLCWKLATFLAAFGSFVDFLDWIKEELEKGNVLVHCMAGVSRSSTITLAYMMKHLDYKLDHALALLRVRRPIASPNSGFMSQLRMYENKLSEAAKRGGGAQGDKKAT